MKVFLLVVSTIFLSEYVVTSNIDDVHKGVVVGMMRMEMKMQKMEDKIDKNIWHNTNMLKKVDSRLDRVEEFLLKITKDQGELLTKQDKSLWTLKNVFESIHNDMKQVKTAVAEVKANINKDMSQQRSVPGWKFIGRGIRGTSSDALSKKVTSFNECVQTCEKKHHEDNALERNDLEFRQILRMLQE